MQISTIDVKNLRSLRDIKLTAEKLTALIGGNNAGKSTILKAIELFFEAAPKLVEEDFTVGSEIESIEITIGFNKLTPVEISEFGSAVIDGELIVTRHLSLDKKESGQYSVQALVFPKFKEIRKETNGSKRRSIYTKLCEELEGLEPVKSHTEINDRLSAWEQSNQDQLKPERVRGFFGAPNVANGKLRKKTGVYLISAVRDASEDADDPKRSAIISLLSEISKQTFENRQEMSEFIERTQHEFNELSDPIRVPELVGISEILTENVKQYYSDSKLMALWHQGDGVSVAYPSPSLKIEHHGIETELSRVGHGLQRAALFSIVQFLAERRSISEEEEEFPEAASDIIILVEEPEIYQHPSKQLVIFEALKKITSGHNRNTGIRVQIIYTTHSEKFVKMTDFNIARIVRCNRTGDDVKNTVSEITINHCSKSLANLLDPPREPMSDDAFVAKLHIFTREVCEGFFADRIILVEGVTDKAILEASYRSRKRDCHQESIAIISVDGKNKMDKPGYIFSRLGIPTYLVFDNDRDEGGSKANILLQKICGVASPEDYPVGCKEKFCSFEGSLEVYLKSQLGEKYDELFNAVAKEYGLNYKEIIKTPSAISSLFVQSLNMGIEFPLFDEIIHFTDALGSKKPV